MASSYVRPSAWGYRRPAVKVLLLLAGLATTTASAGGLPDKVGDTPSTSTSAIWAEAEALSPLAQAGGQVGADTLYQWPGRAYLRVGVGQPFTTIQRALDMAYDGDIVLVEPGTYVENLDFAGKRVALLSAQGPDETTIDGRGCTRGLDVCSTLTFASGESHQTWVEGFTIVGGSGTRLPEAERAAMDPRASRVDGIRLGVPTVGGAVLARTASPTLARLELREGQATFGGGLAILGGKATIIQDPLNSLRGARRGGSDIRQDSNEGVADVRMIQVSVVDNLALLSGGGIYIDGGVLTVQEGRITGNEALNGGGIAAVASEVYMNQVEMLKDRAGEAGGALHLSRATRAQAVMSAMVEGWAAQGALSYVADSHLDLDGGWAAFPRRSEAVFAEGQARIEVESVVAWAEDGENPLFDGEDKAFVGAEDSLENRDPEFADLSPDRTWREDDLGAWRHGDPSAIPGVRVILPTLVHEEFTFIEESAEGVADQPEVGDDKTLVESEDTQITDDTHGLVVVDSTP